LPGIDHHHDGHDHSGHDHSHSHGNEMHLTPADFLALQEALEAEMAAILEQCRGVREVSH
jgi:queuine/archaeosine tRNA-ribosyltransferase